MMMNQVIRQQQALALVERAPIIPVITISDLQTAVPLAKALRDGGLSVLEITLRTPEGLAAIRKIKAEVTDVLVGAGTVLNAVDYGNALAAGSDFLVSPGVTPQLLEVFQASPVPVLPGVATVGELMACLECGFDVLKFFPAEANGGVKALRAIAGPFPQVKFCPTGGINMTNLSDYLALPSVFTVGGSWLCSEALLQEGDWLAIRNLAAETCVAVAGIALRE